MLHCAVCWLRVVEVHWLGQEGGVGVVRGGCIWDRRAQQYPATLNLAWLLWSGGIGHEEYSDNQPRPLHRLVGMYNNTSRYRQECICIRPSGGSEGVERNSGQDSTVWVVLCHMAVDGEVREGHQTSTPVVLSDKGGWGGGPSALTCCCGCSRSKKAAVAAPGGQPACPAVRRACGCCRRCEECTNAYPGVCSGQAGMKQQRTASCHETEC